MCPGPLQVPTTLFSKFLPFTNTQSLHRSRLHTVRSCTAATESDSVTGRALLRQSSPPQPLGVPSPRPSPTYILHLQVLSDQSHFPIHLILILAGPVQVPTGKHNCLR
eukprot:757981-Hanusia_phi.AAC.1